MKRGKEESKERRKREWIKTRGESVVVRTKKKRGKEESKERQGGSGWKIAWRKCSC